MKKCLMAVAIALGGLLAYGAVEVTSVTVQQRYPWNGIVDIDYEVTADNPSAEIWVYPTGYDKDLNQSLGMFSLSGDGVKAPVTPGRHRMTWNLKEDYPNLTTSALSVKMIALTGAAPYMVIDVTDGPDAEKWPVTYLADVPEGGWTDEYKMNKIVLRLCPPGTFMMGEAGYSDNPLHKVTLTKPFYIGVFEITRKQATLVMKNWSYSSGDKFPFSNVSYNNIRGTDYGKAWPAHSQVDASSFMGRIREKANLIADLPTEAQWEYACRAGTSTRLNNGTNTNISEIAWYYNNAGGASHEVGLKLANAWGLYDMHGNVAEWTRDWYQSYLSSAAATDPKGATSGSYRQVRGGGYFRGYRYGASDGSSDADTAYCCSSPYRRYRYEYERRNYYYTTPSFEQGYVGFRLMVTPVE